MALTDEQRAEVAALRERGDLKSMERGHLEALRRFHSPSQEDAEAIAAALGESVTRVRSAGRELKQMATTPQTTSLQKKGKARALELGWTTKA
jgi:hypothetical protein